jgi:putative nucleotidyltransferase with HDIG domain
VIPLTDLVRDIDLAKPLPPTATRLARIAQEHRAEISEIVTVMRYDPSLTAHLLECATDAAATNEPVRRSADVQEAVLRLGIPKVLELAVLQHAAGTLRSSLPMYGLGEDDLWRHAVASALAVEILEPMSPVEFPPGTMTAALLHDIGKAVLAGQARDKQPAELSAAFGSKQKVFSQAECEILGFGHAMIGARLADRWALGPEVVAAIRKHHDLGAVESPATDAVRVANLAAKVAGCGLGAEGLNVAGDAGACGRLGLTRQDFEYLCAEVYSRLPRALQVAEIMARPAA